MPSGNLTMQQMVARQVDLGTYAGPSFIIGHDKGGLIGIAKIEYVGKTARVMARKDSVSKRLQSSRARRSPTRPAPRPATSSSTRSHRGRPEEGRLPGSAHEREQHGGGAWRPRPSTRWSMSSPTTRSPRPKASPIRSWTSIRSTRCRCSWRRRRNSSRRAPTPSSPISRPGSTSPSDFKDEPDKVADTIYSFYTSKGYTMSQGHVPQGAGARRSGVPAGRTISSPT